MLFVKFKALCIRLDSFSESFFFSMKGFSDVVWEQESYLNSIRNKYPNINNNKILESYQNNL